METGKFKLLTLDSSYKVGYFWKTDKEVKGNIVLAHGMCEYSMRYNEFAEFLTNQGYNVYSLDHIGHGENAGEGLGVWSLDTFERCVENIRCEIENLRLTGKPIYLIGHSMGSYMCQYYLEKYGENPHVDKVILIGTSGSRSAFKLGKIVASLHGKFHDNKKPSKFLKKLSFSGFNNKIKKSERISSSDWISSNLEIRKKYINDPFCTFVPSIGFYKSFFHYLVLLHYKLRTLTAKNVPIFIIGGAEDPVTEYGKGLHKLQAEYAKIGVMSEVKIYENMRHELLNEINKEKVYDDIISFLEQK